MGLKIRLRRHKNIPILKIVGDVVGESVRKIPEKIQSLLERDTNTVIIDLSDISSMDSNGLGMFVYSWKQLDSQKKKLLFLNPNDYVRTLFEGSNLHRIFTIIDSLEAL
jgi:anti-sigma B factor antagonist